MLENGEGREAAAQLGDLGGEAAARGGGCSDGAGGSWELACRFGWRELVRMAIRCRRGVKLVGTGGARCERVSGAAGCLADRRPDRKGRH